MRRLAWLACLGFVVVPTVAWTDETVAVLARSDLLALTTEVKQAVPTMIGAVENLAQGTVTFQRTRGDFTAEERVLIRQVVAAHDPLARQRARDAHVAQRDAIRQKLIAGTPLTANEANELVP